MERHTKTSFGSYCSLHFVNLIKCNKVACTLYLILCLYIIKNFAFILYVNYFFFSFCQNNEYPDILIHYYTSTCKGANTFYIF